MMLKEMDTLTWVTYKSVTTYDYFSFLEFIHIGPVMCSLLLQRIIRSIVLEEGPKCRLRSRSPNEYYYFYLMLDVKGYRLTSTSQNLFYSYLNIFLLFESYFMPLVNIYGIISCSLADYFGFVSILHHYSMFLLLTKSYFQLNLPHSVRM
jgi:hypothetical protein